MASKRNRGYLDAISRLPECQTCGGAGTYHDKVGEYLLDPSHVRSRGAGGQDDANLIGQCRACHSEYHRKGRKKFESEYGINLKALAERNWEQWLSGKL